MMTTVAEHKLLLAFDALPRTSANIPCLGACAADAIVVAVRSVCTGANTLPELTPARLLKTLLDVTANTAVESARARDLIEAATARLTPIPEPTFASWIVQYRTSGDRHWSTCSEHITYADAYRDLPARPRAGGEYRILGVTA